jgi:hypothetical protein
MFIKFLGSVIVLNLVIFAGYCFIPKKYPKVSLFFLRFFMVNLAAGCLVLLYSKGLFGLS